VRSDILDLLSLTEDFKKIIGSQEVESGENGTFLFKIVFKTSLDLLEVEIASSKCLKKTRAIFKLTSASNEAVGVSLSALDDLDPLFVNSLELFGFSGQLLGDIVRVKDRLEIGPVTLALEPLFNDILHCDKLVVPIFKLLFEGLLE